MTRRHIYARAAAGLAALGLLLLAGAPARGHKNVTTEAVAGPVGIAARPHGVDEADEGGVAADIDHHIVAEAIAVCVAAGADAPQFPGRQNVEIPGHVEGQDAAVPDAGVRAA